jgi:phosphate transport system permease protein
MSGAPPQGLARTASSAGFWPSVTRRRVVGNWVFWALCLIALALVIAPTLWLVIGIIGRAASHFHFSVLWTSTNNLTGGLRQPILGTIVITLAAVVIGGAISILTGLYLSEFSRRGSERSILRGGYEVLAGIPSIVLGYVGYVALVVGLHWGFGLLPAVLVMTVLVIPYITKATETSLAQVPTGYREGAEALGMSSSYTLRKVVLKAAVPGIVTGAIVAIAIAIGETAPLLYTASFSDLSPSLTITHQAVPYLTYMVYYFSSLQVATTSANILANDAALVLLVLVLVLIIIGRLIAARARRHAES